MVGMTVITTAFIACGNKDRVFSVQTTKEALTVCYTELSNIRMMKNTSLSETAAAINTWLQLQDSTMACMMRDSTRDRAKEYTADFFAVSDSFRTELTRLAHSEKRSLKDVVLLKLNTSERRTETVKSEDYKQACKFYEGLEKEQTYGDLETTLSEYKKLLTATKTFKKEGELLTFIREEDRCFRSLLVFLKDTPQERLQDITDMTAELFDNLYRNTVADLDNEVNSRVYLYLTMRFNRRILQNAEVCRKDIKAKKPLNEQQKNDYRWMIIQPFISIDSYAMATLTDKQAKMLTSMADELPRMLTFLDGIDDGKTDAEDKEKMTNVLCSYFLNAYLNSIL